MFKLGFELYSCLQSGSYSNANDSKKQFHSTILSNYPSNWTKSALQLCPCPKPQLHNRTLSNLDLISIIIIWVVCLFKLGIELYSCLHSGLYSNPNAPKNQFHSTILSSNWTKGALQLCPSCIIDFYKNLDFQFRNSSTFQLSGTAHSLTMV